jgi:hypothetical protein
MRSALIPILLLLGAPAQALDEQEAYDNYIACYQDAVDKLLPRWCHDVDMLDRSARDSCLMEASMVSLTARVRKPAKAVQNAQIDGKLAMLARLREYSKAGRCER